ncbi:MAG: hypothetical protein ABW032_09605, partial [Burkholderiaceae bacterium]
MPSDTITPTSGLFPANPAEPAEPLSGIGMSTPIRRRSLGQRPEDLPDPAPTQPRRFSLPSDSLGVEARPARASATDEDVSAPSDTRDGPVVPMDDLMSSILASLPPHLPFPKPAPGAPNRLEAIGDLSSSLQDLVEALARNQQDGETCPSHILMSMHSTWTTECSKMDRFRTDEGKAFRFRELVDTNLKNLNQYSDGPGKAVFIQQMELAVRREFGFWYVNFKNDYQGYKGIYHPDLMSLDNEIHRINREIKENPLQETALQAQAVHSLQEDGHVCWEEFEINSGLYFSTPGKDDNQEVQKEE